MAPLIGRTATTSGEKQHNRVATNLPSGRAVINMNYMVVYDPSAPPHNRMLRFLHAIALVTTFACLGMGVGSSRAEPSEAPTSEAALRAEATTGPWSKFDHPPVLAFHR